MITLQAIHEAIEHVSGQLEELVEEVTKAGDDAAITEATFKGEFARARLNARVTAGDRKITVDEVEDRATVATQPERMAYLLGANNLTVLREALRARQSRLDALRTLAASFRGAGG